MIRLLALDLDGTLVGDDLTVSPRVGRAVAAAQALGVTVTLATGRMFDVTRSFAQELGIKAPLICYQGALIRATDAAPIYSVTMKPAPMGEVLACQARHGWHVAMYTVDRVFAIKQHYPELFHQMLAREQVVWVDELLPVLNSERPVKFIAIAEPPEADRIEAELRRCLAGRIQIVRSHAAVVEGNPLGVSKGEALRQLAEHVGVLQAETMAIGDQDNDAPMIAWAGVGVAMAGGSMAARSVADWIAPTLAEDGAAHAIERYIL